MSAPTREGSAECGIVGAGVHVPHLRLERAEIARFHDWMGGLGAAVPAGQRSFAGSDEDALTMAVEAVRSARRRTFGAAEDTLFFASTSAPFADRSNAGLIAAASGMAANTLVADISGSLRAGTSALLTACDRASAGHSSIVVASDVRQAKPASSGEWMIGDAAAAISLGGRDVIARLIASATESFDLVDHYREQGEVVDYVWEERWARDVGYLGELPRVVTGFLDAARIKADAIDHACLPGGSARIAAAVAKAIGIPMSALSTTTLDTIGDAGAAAPLLLLARALGRAEPGQLILVAGFGQGVDVLLFQVTEAVADWRLDAATVVGAGFVAPYGRYLALRGMLDVDLGMRAEADKGTAMPAAFRHRDLLTRLVGGRCLSCDTYQIPALPTCVNPECRQRDTIEPYSFADSTARVISFTEDRLTFTADPPARFGLVEFEEGARLMVDFADFDGRALEVGTRVRMSLRIKDRDRLRSFRRYFWKAVPLTEGNS